ASALACIRGGRAQGAGGDGVLPHVRRIRFSAARGARRYRGLRAPAQPASDAAAARGAGAVELRAAHRAEVARTAGPLALRLEIEAEGDLDRVRHPLGVLRVALA